MGAHTDDIRKISSTIRQLKAKISTLRSSLQKTQSEPALRTFSHSDLASFEDISRHSAPSRIAIIDLSSHFYTLMESLACKRQNSLLMAASATVGSMFSNLNEYELESNYNLIPQHCRNWALTNHLIAILAQSIPLPALIPAFAKTCIKLGYDDFGFKLLALFWNRADHLSQDQYKCLIQSITKMRCLNAWYKYISTSFLNNINSKNITIALKDAGTQIIEYSIQRIVINHEEFHIENVEYCIQWFINSCIQSHGIEQKPTLISLLRYGFDHRILPEPMQLDLSLLAVLYNFQVEIHLSRIDRLINGKRIKLSDHISDSNWKYKQLLMMSNTAILVANDDRNDLILQLLVCVANLLRNSDIQDSNDGTLESVESQITALQYQSRPQTIWRFEPLEDCWVHRTPKFMSSKQPNSPKPSPSFPNSPHLHMSNGKVMSSDGVRRHQSIDSVLYTSSPVYKDPITAFGTEERKKRIKTDFMACTPIRKQAKCVILSSSPVQGDGSTFYRGNLWVDDDLDDNVEMIEIDDLLSI